MVGIIDKLSGWCVFFIKRRLYSNILVKVYLCESASKFFLLQTLKDSGTHNHFKITLNFPGPLLNEGKFQRINGFRWQTAREGHGQFVPFHAFRVFVLSGLRILIKFCLADS